MTTSTTPTTAVALPPEGGERLRFLGASTMQIKLDAASASQVAFYEYVSAPGVSGAPQHVHHGHDETFYVVDGHYEFALGHEVMAMPTGSFLFVPRGTPHGFHNDGDRVGRIVGTFNPPRFANYFRELADMIGTGGGVPDDDTWAALYARYDTTFWNGTS